jgi:monoamine oxidase
MEKSNLTRRRFLELVGAAGGSTAVYQASRAMGLMHDTGPVAALDLQRANASGKKAVILGAGIAGLTVAYELEQAGYDVTVVEASHRVGGRNMSIRHGDIIDEMGHRRICNFDDDPDLYFNPGPARIPGHHKRILHYCKSLGIELQVKANFSRPAYVHDPQHFDGKPIRLSRYVADTRGFIAELLYKAVDKNVFDKPLSEEDRERLLQLATAYGDLGKNGSYTGSSRGGYVSGGFIKPGEYYAPLELGALLDSDYWRLGLAASENPDWAEPLMEVKGGMDNITRIFAANIRQPILLNAPVQSIQNMPRGIDIVFNHEGRRKKISADWCFNSIPAHLMVGIPNNFSKDYQDGLGALKPNNFFKIGLQMKERFWEREGIYGGITNTNQRINQIWYPSHGIHKQKGVVLGTYAFGAEQSAFFERMTPEERIDFAGKCGDKVHAGYSNYIEAGVTVPWGRMNHMMGCSAIWTDELREQHYERLRSPEGRHYMIGDQISYHPTWQEGAFASAEYAILDFDQRVRAAAAVSRKE